MGDKAARSRSRPTDERLLEAARAVFAERGFQGATMDAIAARGSSTKPTLYAHFGDKDALFKAVLSQETRALRDWVSAAYGSAAGLPVDQRVRAYVMALFTFAAERPESFRVLFEPQMTGGGSLVRQDVVDFITARVAE